MEMACAKVETSSAYSQTASRLVCWGVSRRVPKDEERAGSQMTRGPVEFDHYSIGNGESLKDFKRAVTWSDSLYRNTALWKWANVYLNSHIG